MTSPPRYLQRSGFTLVELLSVILAILILAALLFPSVSRGVATSKASKCLANWRQYDTAVKLFAADNDGRLPLSAYSTDRTSQVWWQVAPYMVPDAHQMTTSAQLDKLRSFMFRKMGCQGSDWDFGFNSFLSGKRLASISRPSRTIYGMDLHGEGNTTAQWLDGNVIKGATAAKRKELTEAVPKPHSGRVNALYLDGHVETRFVSQIMRADVTRDSSSYAPEDETRPIGGPEYDR